MTHAGVWTTRLNVRRGRIALIATEHSQMNPECQVVSKNTPDENVGRYVFK